MSETTIDLSQVFINALKSLPSMVQRTDLVTTKMTNPDSRTLGGTFTSKDKKVLGVPDDNEILWVPFHLPTHENTKFEVLSKIVGRKSFQLAAEIMQGWYRQHSDEIDEIVSSSMKEEKSVEDLEKEMDRIQKRMELIKSKINDKKG